MSSIQVCIRMRPLLAFEEQPIERQRIILQERHQQVKVQMTEQKEKIFKFNHVLNRQIQQTQLYSAVNMQKLIERVVEGYHSTIFAYGQTGSGKTYTIQGGDTQKTAGIIPKAIRSIFQNISNRVDTNQSQRGFRLFLSFIQIYNESIYDLIDPGEGKSLKMRWNRHQQFTVQNLFECQCRTAEQALNWWKTGKKNKIMGTHKMNNTSSRSHSILTLRLQNYSLQDPSDQIQSKLQIVDLAGSERYKSTKSQGVVFREGIQINKSLFTLRQVIASLYESSTTGKTGLIPPYRDSKLTSLLKQSIGGSSYCLMIACLNPSMNHFEQSLQTLTYASMVSYINNVPTLNIDPKVKQNEQLRQHIYSLNKQIRKLQEHVKILTKLVQSNQCLSCKKRKEGDFNPIQQAKQPLGIVSLPRIHQKIALQNDFEEMHAINKQLFSPKNSNQSKTSHKKTLKSTQQIIQSITMIRDLITSNSLFREKIQSFKSLLENQEKQMFTLMKENQSLRENLQQTSEPIINSATQPASVAQFYRAINRVQTDMKSQKYHLKTYGNNDNIRKQKRDEQSRTKISYNDFLKGKSDFKKHQKKKKRILSQSKRVINDFSY